ncbi:MAG: hypothetical protein ABTR07_04000 [Candidatus Competibacter denitrificans]
MALCKPPPSVATLHRRICKIAQQQGWQPISYSSVYAIVRRLNPAIITLAGEGYAGFRDRFELVHRHRAERPNATWQADHMEITRPTPIRQTAPDHAGLYLTAVP